jgi:hypothetical protein
MTGFIVEEIERSWQNAKTLVFFPSEKKNEPAVIGLLFSRQGEGLAGYDLLADTVENLNSVLVLTKAGNTLNAAFVDKRNGQSVNIKGLQYDKGELANFIAKEPIGEPFAFLLGAADNQGVVFSMSKQPFSPLVIGEYRFENS